MLDPAAELLKRPRGSGHRRDDIGVDGPEAILRHPADPEAIEGCVEGSPVWPYMPVASKNPSHVKSACSTAAGAARALHPGTTSGRSGGMIRPTSECRIHA